MTVSTQNLHISLGGTEILKGIDFHTKQHSFVGIIGPNGSGKSTLIRGIMGLLENTGTVTRGNIYYKGKNVLEARGEELRSLRGPQMGMIFQNTEASLCPVRTIEEQLYESVMEHEKRPGSRALRREVKDRALELFSKMGLTDGERILKSYPFELSGGMNQRVGILLAMILNPALLLADEPTSALDVTVQAQVVEEMMKIRETFGTAIVLVTHNMGVVERMADRVAVMYQGKIVEYGEKEAVLVCPKDSYTRKLLGSVLRIRRQ